LDWALPRLTRFSAFQTFSFFSLFHSAPFVFGFLRPGGVFLCSGVIEGRQEDVERALRGAGLEIVAHLQEEDWHSFAAKMANDPARHCERSEAIQNG